MPRSSQKTGKSTATPLRAYHALLSGEPARVFLLPDQYPTPATQREAEAQRLLAAIPAGDSLLYRRLQLYLHGNLQLLLGIASRRAAPLIYEAGNDALAAASQRPAYLQRLSQELQGVLAAWILAEYLTGLGPDRLAEAVLTDCGGLWRDERTFARLTPVLLHLHSHTIAWFLLEELGLPVEKELLQPEVKHGATIPARRLKVDLREKYLSVMSAGHYQALREALALNTFEKNPDSPWPTAQLNKGAAKGQAQLIPVEYDNQAFLPPEMQEEMIGRMWQQRLELSDADADVLDMLSDLWLKQARTPNDPGTADVDQLLEMRALKPKTGAGGRPSGYRTEQRQQLYQALHRLSSLWINMSRVESYQANSPGGRRRRTFHEVQSRAFVITDVSGERRFDGSNFELQHFLFRPGAVFGQFLFGPGRQTALLSARAVEYDPYRQDMEKRLARYLSWQWRVQATQGSYKRPFKVRTLLEACGYQIDSEHPSRTRERLEKALDTLANDHIIESWQWDDYNEDIAGQRGWAEHLPNWTVLVTPPETIRQAYMNIFVPAQHAATALPPASSLAWSERLQARRTQLGLSQTQAAEQIGIAQSYYSMLEKGARQPSKAIHRQLQEWVRDGETR